MDERIEEVLPRLEWMRAEAIWPNGLRYLWTDAFGLVLLVSLYRATGRTHFLEEARRLVSEVDRLLGRPRGLRIGEAPDRDGQYFHYLAMWMFALERLGETAYDLEAITHVMGCCALFPMGLLRAPEAPGPTTRPQPAQHLD